MAVLVKCLSCRCEDLRPSQHPHKKPQKSVVARVCDLSAGEAEKGGFPWVELTSQPTGQNQQTLGPREISSQRTEVSDFKEVCLRLTSGRHRHVHTHMLKHLPLVCSHKCLNIQGWTGWVEGKEGERQRGGAFKE